MFFFFFFFFTCRHSSDGQRRRRDLNTQTYLNTTENFKRFSKRETSTRSDNVTQSPVNEETQHILFPTEKKDDEYLNPPKDDIQSREVNGYFEYIYKEVNASVLSVTMTKLRHYSHYMIAVKACRAGEGRNCSSEIITNQRTMKIDTTDNVLYLSAEKYATSNHSRGSVKLTWPEPRNPNGFIVSYTIRYQRSDIEHAKYQEICITHNHYKNMSGSYAITGLDNGNYSFHVLATSLAGPGAWSPPAYIYINESNVSVGVILGIIFLLLALIAAGSFAFWYYRRKFAPPDSGLKLIASVNPEYVSMQYTPDEWEVPRERIIQLNELGQGSFGMVYEGIITDPDDENKRSRCAIKTVNENATDRERINFLKEAAVMKAFDTHHVVRLLGVVSRSQPVLVLMELMVNGDLKGYLRLHRPESGEEVQPPTLRRILQMAIEIADGMAYLSAKKFVHRDLAARNCMVAEDLTVKIGDFGMTRDIYETDYYRKGTKGLLPVRWMVRLIDKQSFLDNIGVNLFLSF